MQTEKRSQKIAVTGATGRLGSPLVEILEQRGHEVVPIARSKGVDVVSGEGLDEALAGAEPSSTPRRADPRAGGGDRVLHRVRPQPAASRRARGACGSSSSRSSASKFHGRYRRRSSEEQALLAGPIPTRIVRAAQFHEFVGQRWGGSPRTASPTSRDANPARGRPRRRRNPRGRRRGAGNRERQDQRSSRPAGGASRRYGRRALRQPR